MDDTPCTPEAVGMTLADDAPEWLRSTLDDYLAQFAAPREDDKCACGRRLGGLLGSFTWGIVNGEGFCGECYRPVRGYHRIRDPQGEVFVEFPRLLLYSAVPVSVQSTETGK